MSVGRWRSSMILLGICVVAVLIGALRLATQQAQQPPGSSASTAADGGLALYTWMSDLGSQTSRLTTRAIDPSVNSLIVLEPAALPDSDARLAYSTFADRGGTLVVAGDSLPWLATARALGVTVKPSSASEHATTPDGLSLPLAARFRLRADGAQPLLVAEDGQPVGLRMPYQNGSLIVIASPAPLSNAGLRDDATARFVFRDVVAPTLGKNVAFDELQRLAPSSDESTATIDRLLFQTPAGLALVYAALLTFAYLFFAGRRLGPALVERSAADSPRTMYEHVQMLADLYRRAGQLSVVREAFSRHYARVPQRAHAELPRALADNIRAANTEAQLISAVAEIDDTR